LCVHGGLSPDLKTIDQIRTIERAQEIPHKGAFCDILYYVVSSTQQNSRYREVFA